VGLNNGICLRTQIQAAARRFGAQLAFQRQRAAAATIQAAWRALTTGRAARQQLATQRAAAMAVQAAWRCVVQRRSYLAIRSAVVKVLMLKQWLSRWR